MITKCGKKLVIKKSPLQLRRQGRRKCEAKAKADEAASAEESMPKYVEKCPSINVFTDNQLVIEVIEDSAVNLVVKSLFQTLSAMNVIMSITPTRGNNAQKNGAQNIPS